MVEGRHTRRLPHKHTHRSRMDSHTVRAAAPPTAALRLGAESMLQDTGSAQVPAENRAVLQRYDLSLAGGEARRQPLLAASHGLHLRSLARPLRHRSRHTLRLPMPGRHAHSLVPTMGDVDGINTQPHARRQRRSRTDVPPLLRRLSARSLGSHTRSNALEGHLLLPVPRNGHHCAAQVDRKETVEVALLMYSAPHSFIVHRTQSDWTPNATRLDTERNLIGHRTQPDRTPNAIRRHKCRDCRAQVLIFPFIFRNFVVKQQHYDNKRDRRKVAT